MTISVRAASGRSDDLAWIRGQLPAYLEDLGASSSGLFRTLPEFGHPGSDLLRDWLSEPGATLLTILDEQRPTGFALLRRPGVGTADVDYQMGEFFVARAARQRGFGRSAARIILDRFAGEWEVVAHLSNAAAVAFWRRTLAQYTRGHYRERIANGEVRHRFSSVRA